MKALAIDSAVTCISLAACNQQKKSSITLDIGMRQSEKIIPAIEYVLEQVELDASQLDFIALSGGPGSFTGLRLGFAAAKGLQLSTGCPVYSIPTLKAQAEPFSSWPGIVISVIDAKKDRFYIQIFSQGKEVTGALDIGVEDSAKDFDAAYYLKGQVLESKSPVKNVKEAKKAYKHVIDSYPQSPFWERSQNRFTYLNRFYFDIR